MSSKEPQHNVSQIVADYTPKISAFIRGRVAVQEDAEDILQDVFLQFTRAAENVLDPIEQVGAWLYRVARNTIINRGKKMREQELPTRRTELGEEDIMGELSDILFSGEDSSPSPETEYLRSLVWEELQAALEELPAPQREIFEMTELEGIPVKDISETTGISVNTLLSRKHYAVLHLRERLTELYDELIGG